MRPAAVMRREESSTSLVSTVIRGLGAFLERSQTVHWRLDSINEMTGTDTSRVGETPGSAGCSQFHAGESVPTDAVRAIERKAKQIEVG